MITKKCSKCNREITVNNFNKHFESCNPEKLSKIKLKKEWEISEGIYKCPFCSKSFSKRGIISHIWRTHGEGKNHKTKSLYVKGYIPWNKGLKKENDERVLNNGKTLSESYQSRKIIPGFLGKTHSDKTKKIIGDKLSRNNKGGRCKWYPTQNPSGKRFNVQGTWELAFTQVLNILDENWVKIGINDKKHTFVWENEKGEKHYYTPDFYSPKLKKYFEIKGYWRERDKIKMNYVLRQYLPNLEIIQKKELKSYLTLVGSIFEI